MRDAPIIVGPLEFAGLEGKSILIEHDEDDCILQLLKPAISETNNIIYSPEPLNLYGFNYSMGLIVNSIYKINNIIRKMNTDQDFHIISRVDMMDLNLSKRERGAQVSCYLGMISSKKNLRGANLLISSSKEEHSIRERVDKFINLRK